MAHTFTNLLTHVVFSTKGREPWIDAELRPRLMPYLGGIVHQLHGTAIIADGTADHVHVLLRLPPVLAIAEVVGKMKANSSRWVHETWLKKQFVAWQTGYGAFSVSQSNADAVVEYIRTQEEHHRKMSSQEEFRTILQKHGIEYDERYIWE